VNDPGEFATSVSSRVTNRQVLINGDFRERPGPAPETTQNRVAVFSKIILKTLFLLL
jgi:hypothetical protein